LFGIFNAVRIRVKMTDTPVRQRRAGRRRAVAELKRGMILDAARAVFQAEGLEGASLRAIAARAGYTPAALYFHFDSKEALYAELLQESLAALGARVAEDLAGAVTPADRLRAAGMAFFSFYAENPRELDLGFYLFRGGMKSAGLGRDRDRELNAGLAAALQPIAEAAQAMGATRSEANRLMVDCFAHSAGLLLLLHTGRIRTFGASAPALMQAHLDEKLERLTKG